MSLLQVTSKDPYQALKNFLSERPLDHKDEEDVEKAAKHLRSLGFCGLSFSEVRRMMTRIERKRRRYQSHPPSKDGSPSFFNDSRLAGRVG